MENLDYKDEFYYQSIRKEILPFIPDCVKRVLDIGCGDGLFGKYLKEKFDCEVWGVEFEKGSADRATNNLDKVFHGDIAVLLDELPDNYFDLVVCNDVLEHLYDPYSVLTKVRDKMVENGKVISSIPHIRYYRAIVAIIFNKEFTYTASGIFDRTHIRWFTKSTIKEMFLNSGYKIDKLIGINKSKSIRPFLLNIIFWGTLGDSKYLQYLCVGSK
jgi:2-polyprenyl-3-methyl-5-hydroxy-6-metoxy-1,4-benzoquinol methylase